MFGSFTVIIAIIVAGIAFMQWLTARQKILLDLFEKRFEAYESLREVAAKAMMQVEVQQADLNKYARAMGRARFLFGKEVDDFLIARLNDITRSNFYFKNTIPIPEERRAIVEKEFLERRTRIEDFFIDLDAFVAPYMKHTQKRSCIDFKI